MGLHFLVSEVPLYPSSDEEARTVYVMSPGPAQGLCGVNFDPTDTYRGNSLISNAHPPRITAGS